jgi:hypothetical protein
VGPEHPDDLSPTTSLARKLFIEDLGQVTGGCRRHRRPEPPRFTTLALGEEGGDVTTLAIGEEDSGPDVTTLALGEEG